MTNKRNGFLRFIFSMLPGAAEMYLGFMKMGLSLMTIFFLLIVISVSLESGILMIADVVVWFYAFFHAHNLAGMSDEEFYAVEDEYLIPFDKLSFDTKMLSEEAKKVISICMILIGVVLTYQGINKMIAPFIPTWLNDMIYQFSYSLPKVVVGLAIIYIGTKMIKGKKIELDSENEFEEEDTNE